MNDLIQVKTNENQEPVISARDLHQFLEVNTHYKDWFPRMCEYGFIDGQDFCSFLSESTGGRPSMDHLISLSMAKELCMIQRTEKGKMARQYFIAIEKEYNTPEKIMARALIIADQAITELKLQNSTLSTQNAIMAPKADYFDELVDRNLLTNFRDTAKALDVKQSKFIEILLDKKYIYRDAKGQLKPYAEKNNGLFEIKESVNQKTNWAGTQTLITPKGRETFRLIVNG